MADEPEHQHYKQWLLKQGCRCWPCAAPVEVHHHTHGETSSKRPDKALGGKRGKGQRASDAFGMPMCFRHHKELHNPALRGFFSEMGPRERRVWQDLQVSELRAMYAQEFPNGAPTATAKASRAQRPRSRTRPGKGWTVPLVLSWLRQEARIRPAEVGSAFTELAELIESDTVQ